MRVMHASLQHACKEPRSTAKNCQYSLLKKIWTVLYAGLPNDDKCSIEIHITQFHVAILSGVFHVHILSPL